MDLSSDILSFVVFFPESFHSCLWDTVILQGTFHFISTHLKVPKWMHLFIRVDFECHVLKDVFVPLLARHWLFSLK